MKRILAGVLLFMIAGTALADRGNDEEESTDTLLTRAGNGDEVAQHMLCYRYLYGEGAEKDIKKALRWCESAAAAGISNSQTLLAEMYQLGVGVPIDNERAFSLYKAAAEQGHEHAQLKLGLMYLTGQGTVQNPKAGIDWLTSAAKQGNESALAVLKEIMDAANARKK